METLFGVLGLGALCAGWALFQRWMSRVDPEIGDDPHCGGGCGGSRLRKIENGD
jgi:hypothetical protein